MMHAAFMVFYFLCTFAIIIVVLDRARSETATLKEFNERLVDGLGEGLQLVDGDFRIRHANRWMHAQLGAIADRRCYEVVGADTPSLPRLSARAPSGDGRGGAHRGGRRERAALLAELRPGAPARRPGLSPRAGHRRDGARTAAGAAHRGRAPGRGGRARRGRGPRDQQSPGRHRQRDDAARRGGNPHRRGARPHAGRREEGGAAAQPHPLGLPHLRPAARAQAARGRHPGDRRSRRGPDPGGPRPGARRGARPCASIPPCRRFRSTPTRSPRWCGTSR